MGFFPLYSNKASRKKKHPSGEFPGKSLYSVDFADSSSFLADSSTFFSQWLGKMENYVWHRRPRGGAVAKVGRKAPNGGRSSHPPRAGRVPRLDFQSCPAILRKTRALQFIKLMLVYGSYSSYEFHIQLHELPWIWIWVPMNLTWIWIWISWIDLNMIMEVMNVNMNKYPMNMNMNMNIRLMNMNMNMNTRLMNMKRRSMTMNIRFLNIHKKRA